MIQNSNQTQLDFMNNNSNNIQNLDTDNLAGFMKNLSLDNYHNNFFPFNTSSNNSNNQSINQMQDSLSPQQGGQNWGLRDDMLNFNLNPQGLLNNQNSNQLNQNRNQYFNNFDIDINNNLKMNNFSHKNALNKGKKQNKTGKICN